MKVQITIHFIIQMVGHTVNKMHVLITMLHNDFIFILNNFMSVSELLDLDYETRYVILLIYMGGSLRNIEFFLENILFFFFKLDK